MPISPTVPSAVNAVRPSSLQTTLNDRAFYIFSGVIGVNNTETTMISVNDIGRRDILLCLEVGVQEHGGNDFKLNVKSNGAIIYNTHMSYNNAGDWNEIKVILPANTSLEVTLENHDSASARNSTVAGYGYYLD